MSAHESALGHVLTDTAPAPRAPYSQATIVPGGLIFVSGQGPFTPSGELLQGSFEALARQTFENVRALVVAAGGSPATVARVGVYLRDMDDFAEMNRIYEEYFPAPLPARTCIQSNLPRFPIEVDAVAIVSHDRA
jgi:2-iminobutanoate/2-iminopropanoate deaminase